MVYDLVGAVVEGLQRLSYNVTLENPSFNNMLRILARVLHVPALATLHCPVVGVLSPVRQHLIPVEHSTQRSRAWHL
jgi:hypothetical protein